MEVKPLEFIGLVGYWSARTVKLAVINKSLSYWSDILYASLGGEICFHTVSTQKLRSKVSETASQASSWSWRNVKSHPQDNGFESMKATGSKRSGSEAETWHHMQCWIPSGEAIVAMEIPGFWRWQKGCETIMVWTRVSMSLCHKLCV